MSKLEDARGRLSDRQRRAIRSLVECCEGPEYLDDVAFLDVLFLELMARHEQSAVGWCVVSAHKAMLVLAEDEGILDPTTSAYKARRDGTGRERSR